MMICNENSCTGCMACMAICHVGAITCTQDKQGFFHPDINTKKCIECHICQKVCPSNVQVKYERTTSIFACWQSDETRRWNSTSGGAFLTIAEKFIQDGGIVYGAALDKEFVVRHTRTSTLEEVQKLSGSKYVQSDTHKCYQKVRNDLLTGTKVLFSGTPCQVSALKNFLRKEYDNLYCIDIVCHGVPSPMVFRDYLQYITKQHTSKIKKLNFRYKKPCWSVFSMKIDFENGDTYQASKFQDPFLHFFLAGGVI